MAEVFTANNTLFLGPILNPVFKPDDYRVGEQRPEFPEWTAWVLPWTLVKNKPGPGTVIIDVYSALGPVKAIQFLRASSRRAEKLVGALEATYLAVALKLGVDPKWIAAFVGAADIAAHNLWRDRIRDYVEQASGGIVFQIPALQFVDP